MQYSTISSSRTFQKLANRMESRISRRISSERRSILDYILFSLPKCTYFTRFKIDFHQIIVKCYSTISSVPAICTLFIFRVLLLYRHETYCKHCRIYNSFILSSIRILIRFQKKDRRLSKKNIMRYNFRSILPNNKRHLSFMKLIRVNYSRIVTCYSLMSRVYIY